MKLVVEGDKSKLGEMRPGDGFRWDGRYFVLVGAVGLVTDGPNNSIYAIEVPDCMLTKFGPANEVVKYNVTLNFK